MKIFTTRIRKYKRIKGSRAIGMGKVIADGS